MGTSGKISKDDVNGFSSYSDICVMAKTFTVTYLHQFTPCNYNSKELKIIVPFYQMYYKKMLRHVNDIYSKHLPFIMHRVQ
jgi:hypothetical protein